MTKVRLSLSVSDSHINKFNEVAAAAEQAGMKDEQRLTDSELAFRRRQPTPLRSVLGDGGLADWTRKAQ